MKKDILLITNFWHFKCEKDSSRYLSLAELLIKNEYNLEVITSNFYHRTKLKRNYSKDFLNSFPYKITLLEEPSYKKNISIKRLIAHKKFADNVLNYLKNRKRPDIVIVVIPTHNVAQKVIKYCKSVNLPVILDIQDLWPEAFQMAFDIPFISNIAFSQIKKKANFAYSNADYIIGVSNTYVNRALNVKEPCKKFKTIYLGSNMIEAKKAIKENSVIKDKNEFWITYIGALGHSYDIKLVIDAISLLNQKGIANIKFNLFGNGVLENEFKKYALEKKVNAHFYGHTNYDIMMAYLYKSDIAVNPIIGKSVASIINKVCDYATAGAPVINSQNSEEYRTMIDKYKCGINCNNGDVKAFSEAILKLYNDEKLRKEMRNNSLKMAEENFNREKTYFGFIEAIEYLSGKDEKQNEKVS